MTCLAVNGNTATINFTNQWASSRTTFTVEVVDDQPDTWAFTGPSRPPTDCSPLSDAPEVHRGPLSSGDFTVVDAQVPTTNDQCKGDGWKQFGFANQGLCLAFVNR